jgi:hypothetical protein
VPSPEPEDDPGIHFSVQARACAWIAGSSPAMTVNQAYASVHQHTDRVGRLFAMEFSAAAAVHLSDRGSELDS